MPKANCADTKIQQVNAQIQRVFPASKDHWATRSQELLLVLFIGLPSLKKFATSSLSAKLGEVKGKVDCENIHNILSAISTRREADSPIIQQLVSFFLQVSENELSMIVATMMSYIGSYLKDRHE